MKCTTRSLIATLQLLLVAHACSIAWAGGAVSAPSYRLSLAGFNEGPDQGETGWNNLGQATFIRSGVVSRGYWWDGAAEHRLDTGNPSSSVYAWPFDINDAGRIPGRRTTLTESTAVYWDQGVLQVVGTLGGKNSEARAVNENGVLAGWSETNSTFARSLFTWDGAFHNLGRLPADDQIPMSMNNALQVVGHANSQLHAWLWENGVFYLLSDLNGGNDTMVGDINEAGIIVGNTNVHQTEREAVMWVNHQVFPLPVPAGLYGSVATDINEAGTIAGAVVFPTTFESAVSVWIDDQFYLVRDHVTNLGDWQLLSSIALDDRGRILAFARSESHTSQPWQRVILTPVPEPTTGVLAALATFLAAAAGMARISPIREQSKTSMSERTE